MSIACLRLDQIPINYVNLRAFAPRADGLDQLPAQYTDLGFGPYAAQGTVIEIDATLLRTDSAISPVPLPAGVSRVYKASVTMPHPDPEMVGATVGGTVYLSPRAFNKLLASGHVVAA